MIYLHSKWHELQSNIPKRELWESFYIVHQCAIHFVFKQGDEHTTKVWGFKWKLKTHSIIFYLLVACFCSIVWLWHSYSSRKEIYFPSKLNFICLVFFYLRHNLILQSCVKLYVSPASLGAISPTSVQNQVCS